MATLAALRTILNGMVGVVTDAETSPWTQAVRNQAISDGYAELERVGVWKPTVQSITSVEDQQVYALTNIHTLHQIDLLESSGLVYSNPVGHVEPDGAGGYQLRLKGSIDTGETFKVYGFTSYKSTFSSDADTDDLPAAHVRVPLLKAKSILYEQQLALFMRFQARSGQEPPMAARAEDLLAIKALAEREFDAAARALAGRRWRAGQAIRR